MLTEGGRWSKKVKSCKRSLWTPPCINCYISCPLPSIDQFQKNGIRTFKIAEQNATWSKWSKQHKIYCFPIFCSFGLNFSYVTQYFLRILRNNVFLSLMRKFCKIFLNFEPRIEIVMNELRRFKHSADIFANSSHIIEPTAISASQLSTPLTHLHWETIT